MGDYFLINVTRFYVLSGTEGRFYAFFSIEPGSMVAGIYCRMKYKLL